MRMRDHEYIELESTEEEEMVNLQVHWHCQEEDDSSCANALGNYTLKK